VCRDTGFLKLHDAASAECWFNWTVDPLAYVSCFVYLIYTVQHYASTLYAVIICPSVCLSLAGIVSKRLESS